MRWTKREWKGEKGIVCPCYCSLYKVRRLAEGQQMQTKRRGKGGGREWDDMRKDGEKCLGGTSVVKRPGSSVPSRY